MSELSKALGDTAPKHTIEANGKTYEVGLITQAVKVGYEKRLYQHAKDAVTALRRDMDSEEYVGMLTKLTDAYEEGQFALEGQRGMKAIQSAKGSLILVSLLTGADEIEVMNAVSAKPQEFATVIDTVIKESFPGAKVERAGPADPNG